MYFNNKKININQLANIINNKFYSYFKRQAITEITTTLNGRTIVMVNGRQEVFYNDKLAIESLSAMFKIKVKTKGYRKTVSKKEDGVFDKVRFEEVLRNFIAENKDINSLDLEVRKDIKQEFDILLKTNGVNKLSHKEKYNISLLFDYLLEHSLLNFKVKDFFKEIAKRITI